MCYGNELFGLSNHCIYKVETKGTHQPCLVERDDEKTIVYTRGREDNIVQVIEYKDGHLLPSSLSSKRVNEQGEIMRIEGEGEYEVRCIGTRLQSRSVESFNDRNKASKDEFCDRLGTHLTGLIMNDPTVACGN